jgi:predicted phage baseplate assembly protein
MTCPCGCCEGVSAHLGVEIVNSPGLDALAYRVGTHGSFLEAMIARLTSHRLTAADGQTELRPLQRLTARASDDFSIALLDAWATVADVLTFYQQLIANEGFLRTATERRSLLELGRLVGYRLRPPLGATAYLAFTLTDDPTAAEGVTIATGSRAQSVPRPGELPQSFETVEDVHARASWNALRPRTEQPQRITPALARAMPTLVLNGIVTTLAVGDWLLFDFGDAELEQVVRRVSAVTPDRTAGRTTVELEHDPTFAERVRALADALARYRQLAAFGLKPGEDTNRITTLMDDLRRSFVPELTPTGLVKHSTRLLDAIKELSDPSGEFLQLSTAGALTTWLGGIERAVEDALGDALGSPPGSNDPLGEVELPPLDAARPFDEGLERLLDPLRRPPTLPPADSARLARDPAALYSRGSDLAPQLLVTLHPELRTNLYQALAGASLADAPPLRAVYGVSRHAAPFGATASLWTNVTSAGDPHIREWLLDGVNVLTGTRSESGDLGRAVTVAGHEPPHSASDVALDASYPDLLAGTWVLVQRGPAEPEPRRIDKLETKGVAGYNMSAKVTRLTLGPGWLGEEYKDVLPLSVLRQVTIHVGAEPLELAPEPVPEPVAGSTITLDGLVNGLQSGRWLVVAGERADIAEVQGLYSGELVMLAAVSQELDPTLAGDGVRTVLRLATPLRYSYVSASVTVWGNVAKATQGETHSEILGSGDASKPQQAFALALRPLAYLPDASASGAASTLEIRVDDVLWHEAADALALAPQERGYVTATDDDDTTSVRFGVGAAARLPSGPDNVRGTYRVGAGASGNVDRERITQLMTRPLGVRDVTNPLPSTGGADRENVVSARKGVPLGVAALDRLVSVRDYADFTKARAGIGKASAVRVSDGQRQFVHVTIAGIGDAPIAETSDLFRALKAALLAQGDPQLPLQIAVRELALIAFVAGIRVQPDASWPVVERRVRDALLEAFGFDRREFGDDVVLSRLVACAQAVDGVEAVDADGLALVHESITAAQLRDLPTKLAAQPPQRLPVELARLGEDPAATILPARLAIFSPDVPDTLILREARP